MGCGGEVDFTPMAHIEDSEQLKGVARSLDNLFSQMESERVLLAAEADLESAVVEASGPTAQTEHVEPEEELEEVEVEGVLEQVEPEEEFEEVELEGVLEEIEPEEEVEEVELEGVLEEIEPEEEVEQVDPEEELRVRVQGAKDSLASAVERFISGEGDMAELSQSIRNEASGLHEAGNLDPVIDAVERLALVVPVDDPSHGACELARSLATPAVSAGLAMRLADARDDERRDHVTRACRCLGDEGPVALAMALAEAGDRSARRNLVEGLVAMGSAGLKQAELMVQEGSSWGVVRNGVAILGELGGERAVEHLMDTVRHHHPKVRRETLTALTRVGGDGANLLVMGALDDEDDEVRATAVRAVAALDLGSERTVKALLTRLDDEENQDVQEEILRALGQFGDPVVVPAIEKRAVGGFFSRPPVSTRIAAYRALAAIGTPRARSLVEAAAKDKDAEVKSVARSLLAADREARSDSGAPVVPSDAPTEEP